MLTNVTVTAEAQLTPEQVAEAFWNLSSDEQAAFFFHLGHISGGMLGMQAIYMREACGSPSVDNIETAHSAVTELIAVSHRLSAAIAGYANIDIDDSVREAAHRHEHAVALDLWRAALARVGGDA